MFKVNNKDTRTTPLICPANQLTGFCMRRRSSAFIVNFEHISYLVLVFLLLTLNMSLPAWLAIHYFYKILYHRCLTLFFIHLCPPIEKIFTKTTRSTKKPFLLLIRVLMLTHCLIYWS